MLRINFPLVLAFSGRFGSGKTALASYMAVREASELGCPLWANFSLRGASPVRSMDDLYQLRDGILVLDELQSTIHARTFSKNLAFLDWFDQHRKQGLIFLYITQELRKVDVLVRDMTDFAILCTRLDSRYSNIEVWDLYREKRISTSVFDRSLSYGLYEHTERAWPIAGASAAADARARAGNSSSTTTTKKGR